MLSTKTCDSSLINLQILKNLTEFGHIQRHAVVQTWDEFRFIF